MVMAISASSESSPSAPPVTVGGFLPSSGPPQTVGLIQQFVETTGQLYSLPAAAAEILRLTGALTIDLKAIKTCVESDPALAARILRVTNSSLFGPCRQVTDLSQALTLLGIRPLKILVLGFSLPRELFTGIQAQVLSWYWRHTLIKAVAARELAERSWRTSGDEAFLAGLVQDIGVLALIQQLGPAYLQLISHVRTHGGSLLAYELDTLGFDHLVLSARLLAQWGLPPGLCAAVSVPPHTERILSLSRDERLLPQILHLAELLARLIEQPYGSALHDFLTAGGAYCGLAYESLQPLATSVQRKVQDLADVLSLDLPEGQSYVDLLLAAHDRLASETLVEVTLAPQEEISSLAGELQRELTAATRRSATLHPPSAASTPPMAERRNTPSSTTKPVSPTRDRAAGLACSSNLQARVTHLLETARQLRKPLALVLFEVDRYPDLVLQLGAGGAREAVSLLTTAVADWAGATAHAELISDSRIGLICCGNSRSETVQIARQVLISVPRWSRERLPLSFELTFSAGLAALDVPPRNYPAKDMVTAAERCLTAAMHSGGNTAKSIDL